MKRETDIDTVPEVTVLAAVPKVITPAPVEVVKARPEMVKEG